MEFTVHATDGKARLGELEFDRGTILLQAPEERELAALELPGAAFDRRVGLWRAPACRYRELVLALDGFDAAVSGAYEKRAPNILCEHAFKLAQAFSKFYAACPVMGESDPAVRGSRLTLAATTLRQLELALDLLGMESPERM